MRRPRATSAPQLATLLVSALSVVEGWRVGPTLMMSAAATRESKQRHPGNVAGNLFVDKTCIDCDTCRWMSGATYGRVDGQSVVTRQPQTEEERREAYRAMVSCPVGSIRTERGDPLVKAVLADFPLPIHEQELPGVYHLGYHAASTYGCASYLIRGARGNIMMDVPRYSSLLAQRIEDMGGVDLMVLSHRDDVGEHARWKARFPGCLRVLHETEVDGRTQDVEVKLEGQGPSWTLPGFDDVTLLFIPGHTPGHVGLLLSRGTGGALFSGDHLAAHEDLPDTLTGHPDYNWYRKDVQARSIVGLADVAFQWLLPGHGRRYRFQSPGGEERRRMLEQAARTLVASTSN